MRGRTSLLAVLAAAVVGSSGCTGHGPEDPVEQADPWSTPATTVWSADAQLVGDPAVAEDVVVSYVREGEGIAITAWDLATGAELWTAPAIPGGSPPGVQLNARVVVADGQQFAAYFVPHPRAEFQRVVLADARTGAPVSIDRTDVAAASHIQVCGDDSSVFCFEGMLPDDETVAQYELDPLAGTVKKSAVRQLPDNARLIGTWTFSTAGRPPAGQEMLGLLGDGQVAWTRPYEEVFGPGFSSDGGWGWSDEQGLDVIVGTGRYVEEYGTAASDGGAPPDPALHRTVGLQRKTGATVWSLDSTTWCPFQPDHGVVGGAVVLCVLPTSVAQDPKIGSQTDEHQGATTADTGAWIVGVDVATGETVWSVPIDDTVLAPSDGGFHSSNDVVVVEVDGSLTVVDPIEGPQPGLAEDATVTCWQNREPMEFMFKGELRAYSIGHDYLPCDASGAQQAVFSVAAARLAGQKGPDGLRVVATSGSLMAVEVPDD